MQDVMAALGELEPEDIQKIKVLAAGFDKLRTTQEWKMLSEIIEVVRHSCAENALADGRLEFWKGVRYGLAVHDSITAGIVEKDDIIEEQDLDDDVNQMMPVPGMHG